MEISNWTKLAVVVIVCIAAIILGMRGSWIPRPWWLCFPHL